MLFELHDLWLHRRWLKAKAKRLEFVLHELSDNRYFSQKMAKQYNRLVKAECKARDAYLSHKRRVSIVDAFSTRFWHEVDRYKDGRDLKDMFFDWTTKVRL